MRMRKLGPLGDVSVCCLGTMTWGACGGASATACLTHSRRATLAGNQNTAEEAFAQLDAYTARGGNFIDTAELYPVPPGPQYVGRTEEIIGQWLEKHPEMRAKVVLATKVRAAGVADTRWRV